MLIAISSFKTLSSIFNIEMVKDKTAEEIQQVMNENEYVHSLKIFALWSKSENRKGHIK